MDAQTETAQQFGDWLLRQITIRRWTPAEFVRRAHVPQSAVSSWLNNTSRPSAESCWKIARTLGMSTTEVLTKAGRLEDAPAPTLMATPPEYDRAERIVSALSVDPDVLDKWLDMGEAMAKVVR